MIKWLVVLLIVKFNPFDYSPALSYFTTRYGQFSYDTLRIVEVPNGIEDVYTTGNMIALPEEDGWLQDYQHGPGVDWIRYVIGRELAKHWWQQQLNPAEVKGSLVLTEGLPKYEALNFVMQKAYAKKHTQANWDEINRFLTRFQDDYRQASALEDQSLPTLLSTDHQDYMVDKAAYHLFGLRAFLGADKFDTVLQSYLRTAKQDQTKLPNLADLHQTLQQAAGSSGELQYVNAMFGQRLRHDNRIEDIAVVDTATQGKRVKVWLNSRQQQLSELGNATDVQGEIPMQFAVVLRSGQHHFLTPQSIKTGESIVSIDLPAEAQTLVLDPMRFYMDESLSDNQVLVP